MFHRFGQKAIALLVCFVMLPVWGILPTYLANAQATTATTTQAFKDESQVQEEFQADAIDRNINLPQKMTALQLQPGVDFLTETKNTDATLVAEVQAIISKAQAWSMNTLVVITQTEDGTLLQNQTLARSKMTEGLTMDPVTALIDAAKANNLFVLCTLDLTAQTVNGKALRPDYYNAAVADEAAGRARQFAHDYHPDGVLFTGWEYTPAKDAYDRYLNSASGIGFENELNEQTGALIDSAAYGVQITDFAMAIGLWCNTVWANKTTDTRGSQTTAAHQMKTDDYLDLPTLLAGKKVDYLYIDCPGSLTDTKIPFERVAAWWQQIGTQYDLPITLLLHNEKLGQATGFSSPDQIVRQVIAADKAGVRHFAFASFQGLAKNWQDSTDVLQKQLAKELNTQLVLKDLYMTRPSKGNFVTYDNTVLFTGTGDPNFPLTLNGKKLEIDAKGNFASEQTLKLGKNTFTISHKSTTFTYVVQKKVLVIKGASPLQGVAANGGTTLSFTMKAYKGATCYAMLGKVKIPLTASESTDEADRESDYVDYSGVYTLPAAKEQKQNLGQVAFYASYMGMNESKKGGNITVNAKPPAPKPPPTTTTKPTAAGDQDDPKDDQVTAGEDAVVLAGAKLIQIVTDRAETFRTTTLDNWADSLTFDYPGGTYDFVESTVTFTDTYSVPNQTYTYFNLRSGRRVYHIDYDSLTGKPITVCKEITDTKIMQSVARNHIQKAEVTNDGRNTVFTIEMNKPVNPVFDLPDVTYAPSSAVNFHPVSPTTGFAPTYLSFKIPYVDNAPNLTPPSGSLFSKFESSIIQEDGARKLFIKCYFHNGKAFSGADAKIDDQGRLIVTIRNAFAIEKADNRFGYSLKGLKVGITPGHGGGDPGALGFKGINEKDLNFAVADLVGEYLEEAGATVVQLPREINDKTAGLIQKMENARKEDPDILLCLHHNSAGSSATGVETYYYTSFTYTMAKAINDQIAKDCGIYNRGAKMDVKYMTRDKTFPAILLEYGFISNPKEFANLSDPEYQKKEAMATVKGIIQYALSMQPTA